MLNDRSRPRIAVTDGEDEPPGPAEVQLDDNSAGVARRAPGPGLRRLAPIRGECRMHQIVGRVRSGFERGAGGAAAVGKVRRADLPGTMAAAAPVGLTAGSAASGAGFGPGHGEGDPVHVTDGVVLGAGASAPLIGEPDQM